MVVRKTSRTAGELEDAKGYLKQSKAKLESCCRDLEQNPSWLNQARVAWAENAVRLWNEEVVFLERLMAGK